MSRVKLGCTAAVVAAGWLMCSTAAAASAAAHVHPPTLRAGETWSYVVWKLLATPDNEFATPCNVDFGNDGTQTCDGHYDSAPFPNPGFGGWGFNGDHNGTSKASRARGQKEMTVTFFTPGAEIAGTIPDESSDRYTVTNSQGPGGWKVKSPSDSEDYHKIAAGKKGGPLHLDVTATQGVHKGYTFEVYGYVVVERSAM